MAEEIDEKLFLNFRLSAKQKLKRFLSEVDSQSGIVEALFDAIDKLSSSLNPNGEPNPDYEYIEALAHDLVDLDDFEFLRTVDTELSNRKPHNDVHLCFLQTLRSRMSDLEAEASKSFPSLDEIIKLKSRVESDGPIDQFSNLKAIYSKAGSNFIPSMAHSREIHLLIEIASYIQSIGPSAYQNFYQIFEKFVEDVFLGDSSKERLWVLWARGRAILGDTEAANSILWDAFRRFPESSYIAFALHRALGWNKYGIQNRIRFIEMCSDRFWFHDAMELERSRLLGMSKFPNQFEYGLVRLMSVIKRSGEKYFAVSLAAAQIDLRWKHICENQKFRDTILAEIKKWLAEDPGLIGAIATLLVTHQNNHEASEWLLQNAIPNRASNEASEIKTINLRAKLLAAEGDDEGVSQAIELLDGIDDQVSRNHRAKILATRGHPKDIDEAETVLRQNLLRDDTDVFAISQLASLLYHNRGDTGIEEAKELLYPHISENERLRANYVAMVSGEFGENSDVVEYESVRFETDPAQEGYWSTENLCSYKISPSVIDLGRFRCLKFEIEFGVRKSKEAAIHVLENQNADYEYLSFIKSAKLGSGRRAESSTASIVGGIVRSTANDLTLLGSALSRVGSRFGVLGEEISHATETDLADPATMDPNQVTSFELAKSRRILLSRFGRNLLKSFSESQPTNYERRKRQVAIEDVAGSFFESGALVA